MQSVREIVERQAVGHMKTRADFRAAQTKGGRLTNASRASDAHPGYPFDDADQRGTTARNRLGAEY